MLGPPNVPFGLHETKLAKFGGLPGTSGIQWLNMSSKTLISHAASKRSTLEMGISAWLSLSELLTGKGCRFS